MKKLKWFIYGMIWAQLSIGFGMRMMQKMGIIHVETDPDVISANVAAYVERAGKAQTKRFDVLESIFDWLDDRRPVKFFTVTSKKDTSSG